MNKQDLIKFVQQKESEGLVVLASHEGLSTIPLVDLIAQPSEGILYDLNRGKIVSLTFLDDPKWINDYAVACVIDALKAQTEALKKEIAFKNFIYTYYQKFHDKWIELPKDGSGQVNPYTTTQPFYTEDEVRIKFNNLTT